MIEPSWLVQGVLIPAIVSLTALLLTPIIFRKGSGFGVAFGWVLALGIGLVIGYHATDIDWPDFPPQFARQRLWIFLLPGAAITGLIASIERAPRWIVWSLRTVTACSIGPALLYAKLDPDFGWSATETLKNLGAIQGVALLLFLSVGSHARSQWGRSSTFVMGATFLALFAAMALSGSVLIGQYALTPAAIIFAGLLGGMRSERKLGADALADIGVTLLVGLLAIGVFFNELRPSDALLIAAAPLLLSIAELPGGIRNWKPWATGLLRICLAAIPATVAVALLVHANQDTLFGDGGGDDTPAGYDAAEYEDD